MSRRRERAERNSESPPNAPSLELVWQREIGDDLLQRVQWTRTGARERAPHEAYQGKVMPQWQIRVFVARATPVKDVTMGGMCIADFGGASKATLENRF